MWKLVEPGFFNSGTFMWNLVEPRLLRVEPCGTSTFSSGTFMWNLVEPELLTVEPLCGTSTFHSGTLFNLNFLEWNLYVEPCGT